MLFGDSFLSAQRQTILDSCVVHATIDPTILSASTTTSKTKEDNDEASDPDRIITNARVATPEDGLLTIPDIVAWFAELPRLRSAYCEGVHLTREIGVELETFGTREFLPPARQGFDEPEFTSYTFYWKSVLGKLLSCQLNLHNDTIYLDYIFFMDAEQTAAVTGLAIPPSTDDLEPGIPKEGVSGSDHIALIAEITWQLN